MKKLFGGWLLAVAFSAATPAHAAAGWFYFDAFVGVGGGSSSTAGDTSAPQLGSTMLGATIGAKLWKERLILGGSADYHWLTQFNTTDANTGNRRGTFISPISPFLGFAYRKALFKLNVFVTGTYDLANPTISGQAVSYNSPLGVRFGVDFPLGRSMRIGPFFETVSLAQKTVAGQSVSASAMGIWQAGISLSFTFHSTGSSRGGRK